MNPHNNTSLSNVCLYGGLLFPLRCRVNIGTEKIVSSSHSPWLEAILVPRVFRQVSKFAEEVRTAWFYDVCLKTG